MSKTCCKEINGKTIKLTKEVEVDAEILDEKTVQNIANLRAKNKNVDLSIYTAKVKQENE
jgi:hypothetical protein